MPSKSTLTHTENIASAIAAWVGTPLSIIVHTLFFIGIFSLRLVGVPYDDIMLILTTLVSLEAIYLSLFIQMTVNRHSEHLEDVEEDIDGIQEDVEDISTDIDNVQENVESLESNIKEIQEDVQGIEADVENIVEDTASDSDQPVLTNKSDTTQSVEKMITKVSYDLQKLTEDIQSLKQDIKSIRHKANRSGR